MIPLQRPQLPSLVDAAAYYRAAEDARWYSNNGPCARELTHRIEERLSVSATLVANCTWGIVVALRAATIEFGTQHRRFVVCPSFTFVATVSAIVTAGFEPLFIDVDPSTWQPDTDALTAALGRFGDDVAAVLGTSTFGTPAPAAVRSEWHRFTADAGVPLVIDSAAAFGAATDDGQLAGAGGDVEVFSFHATKPFAIGEGGVVTTRHPNIAHRLAQQVNFGFDAQREVVAEGTNAKLCELASAMGLAMWDFYDQALMNRRTRARVLRDALVAHDYTFQQNHECSTWQMLFVQARSSDHRNVAEARAAAMGVETRRYYGLPLHLTPHYRNYTSAGSLEVTSRLCTRALAWPMANDLDATEIASIVEAATGATLPSRDMADIADQLEACEGFSRSKELTWN